MFTLRLLLRILIVHPFDALRMRAGRMTFGVDLLDFARLENRQEQLLVEIARRQNDRVREEIIHTVQQISTIHRLIGCFSEVLLEHSDTFHSRTHDHHLPAC